MVDDVYDLAIVGGGINGVGIAADAAGRGLKVVLVEANDLASATSSASSKLVHGGLRYLEHGELRLVREALGEREIFLERAPHLVRPLRFIIPHTRGMRPLLLLRLGLFLYDRLATRRRIPGSRSVDFARDPAFRPLRPEITRGLSYYDCQVDDARLVVAVAQDASERGAALHTRTRVVRAQRSEGAWCVDCDGAGGPVSFAARVLVNAAGPWCADVARLAGRSEAVPRLRLVRGSHIVIPRIAGAEDGYLLQAADGRVVFALPFEGAFTLIGTTEVTVSDPAEASAPSADEERYLLDTARRFFALPLSEAAIQWRFAGVRPLVEDGAHQASAVSRDYRLDLHATDGGAPLMNVIGGKITTFRRLAEAALAKLTPFLPAMGPRWTADKPLPGGDGGSDAFPAYCQSLAQRHPAFDPDTLWRLASRYGTRADRVLSDARTPADLGRPLGGGLTEREVIYLRDHEWARTPDDVLWRRTKAGLHMSAAERETAAEAIARLLE